MRAFALAALMLATPAFAQDMWIEQAWMAATDAAEARFFVGIRNESDLAVTLQGFRADWAEAALMGAPVKAGEGEVPLDGLTLVPGEELEMEPEGVFVRLTGLTQPMVEGDTHEVTLILASSEEIAIELLVEGPDAETESHAGHNH